MLYKMNYKIIQITPAAKGWYLATHSEDDNGNKLNDDNGNILFLEEIAVFALVEDEDGDTETRAMTGEYIIDCSCLNIQYGTVLYLNSKQVKEIRSREKKAIALIGGQG